MKKADAVSKNSGSRAIYTKTKFRSSRNKTGPAISVLSALLAKEMALYIKTRNYHWNVSGKDSIELHKLLQYNYQLLENSIKEVSEQINKINFLSIIPMKELLKFPDINEVQKSYPSSKEMIRELIVDHDSAIQTLRNDINYVIRNNRDIDIAGTIISHVEMHEAIVKGLRGALYSLNDYRAVLHN